METTRRAVKIAYEEPTKGNQVNTKNNYIEQGASKPSLSPENREDVYYFRVQGANFNDLHDFRDGNKSEKKMTKVSTFERDRKSGQVVHLNKKEIALFRYGEKAFAIDEKCPHVGGPLHLGDIETISEANILCIVCPWHRWKIELGTGKLKIPQRSRETKVYPVKVVNNGELYIGFNEFAPAFFEGSEEF